MANGEKGGKAAAGRNRERPLMLIEAGKVRMEAELNTTRTAQAVYAALPFEGKACLWGDEIYFEIPLDLPPENPQGEAPSGAIAYWPPGKALCIFFGQTPYSPVNIVGKLRGNPEEFRKVAEGETVRVTRA
jgi:hypothetical protein